MKSVNEYPFGYAQFCFIVGCVMGVMSYIPSLASKFIPSAPEVPFIPALWIIGAAFGIWGLIWMIVISNRTSAKVRCL